MLSSICNKLIAYCFYALFFFVPLFFTSNTSELFELNKMWLTWGLAVVIMGAWIIRMISERRIVIARTPLDIPIVLFLLSQLISTIFTLDSRVSFWGYYSRFNGGFLSMLTYVLLYYAFVSNVTFAEVKRFLKVTLLSGIIVALWGLPSHFGYDPTCLIFRGTLDTSCWTESFKPTIRIFSTLGQPAWMAAYLAVLLPLSMATFIKTISTSTKEHIQLLSLKIHLTKKQLLLASLYLLLIILFYLDLLFSNTRGGFLAFWAANGIFWVSLFALTLFPLKKLLQVAIGINLLFFACNFLVGTPVEQLNKFTLRSMQKPPAALAQATSASRRTSAPDATSATSVTKVPATVIDPGITDSGKIRLLVWEGAIEAWKKQPVFGTGVETFAFAYYATRPAEHNLTSEWDFLYNKAHNEYLNYLTTTGAVGLGTQLLFIGGFLFLVIRYFPVLRSQRESQEQIQNVLLATALPAAFVSIIISNFFGFSVVIINLFLFFIPLWFFLLIGSIDQTKSLTFSFKQNKRQEMNLYQWTGIAGIVIVCIIFIFQLIVFWKADTAYALGYNYDRAGAYDTAYPHLTKAVQLRPAEPVFKDELSINLATLATALIQNNNATAGAQLANSALTLSKEVTSKHPNNVVFLKTSVRVYYLLAQIDNKYYQNALQAILSAQKLAPTDAKISYNVGVMYGHTGQFDKAIEELSKTIKLKLNYRDAYYARALFYRQLAESGSGVQKTDYQTKATADLQSILTLINPNDEEAQKLLESWGVSPN